MGIEDKARNAAQDAAGKVKEGVGRLTGDDRMEAEGKIDQAKAAVKKTAEEAKDTIEDQFRG
ncbi:MAG: CsbD family protein [Propionicimonas sp.]|uniref:CsbD family protein n=1 Tax=Propionicimonas sp. TaxID=1955623 RepID=UPI002B220359|nr:CsbD family protein [Propionicimonas sp.]MEA4945282.1 CsbD family protein [Propionicimonas sp.]MEA5055350.1 CsbD family protein [Propionicimonas sp.]MEA5119351.1 CsbD family protein [Propionicimonas sp.]